MSKKKSIAKRLGASALAVATVASGLSFGATAASAAPSDYAPLYFTMNEHYNLTHYEGAPTPVTKADQIYSVRTDQLGNMELVQHSSAASAERDGVKFLLKNGRLQTSNDLCLGALENPSVGAKVGIFPQLQKCGLANVNGTKLDQRVKIGAGDRLIFNAFGHNAPLAYAVNNSGVSWPIGVLNVNGGAEVGGEFARKTLSAMGAFATDIAERATISGVAETGATVVIKMGSVEVGRVAADPNDGSYSWSVPAPNQGGTKNYTVSQIVSGTESGNVAVSLNYGNAVAITDPADNSTQPAGTKTITGTTQADATVSVKVNGGTAINATVTGTTWTAQATLLRGENMIEATQKSKGANTTSSTVVVNPGESANAPLDVQVESVDNDARTAQVFGTATPGAQVRVGNTVVATTAADGSWNGRISGLAVGVNTVEFVQYVGAARVDAVSKDIRVVATGFELTSPQNNDVIRTADKSVTFTGLGNPGGKVSVLNGNKSIGSAIVDADGKWSFTSVMAYTEYDLTVFYKKNPAGGVTNQLPLHITVTNNDQNAPFEITAPEHNSTVTAPDKQVRFEGTGTTGGIVTIKKGTQTVGTAEVGADGTWAFTGELSFNKHNLTAYYKKMPSSSAVSSPLTVTVTDGSVVLPFEVTSPANDSVVETADKSVTFTGEGAGGGKVVIKKGNATLAEGLVDGRGKWSLTGTLNYGEQDVTVFHKPVGSSQAQQVRLNLIVQAPAADFAIESPADGDTVAAGPVTFTGIGKNGTTVSVFVNGKSRGTATVENGTWTLQTSAISSGTHDFVVYYKQGSVAAESETLRLTLR